jgi:tight adherence protein B
MTVVDESRLAGHLHRLAVLIAAGLTPRAAWSHAAGSSPEPVLAGVVTAIDEGAGIPDALDAAGNEGGDAWRSLAAAWRVAAASGAPLAPALRGFAEGLRDREAARRDIRVALAGPRATARIVMVLPAVAVLLGLLMGVDLAATVATPLGAGAIGGGLLLMLVARRWMRRLLRAAEPPPPTVGLALDLLAVAAGGGGAPEAAAALVRAELDRSGLPVAQPDPLDDLVRLSRAAGAPLGELARAEAIDERARARAAARETAEQLAVRLMLPLGACILPAFLLLGVVPMLIGLLSSTAGAF